ncbi:hypothetical protein [Prosthecobacter sp.]|uniref:hypothetical protein n=1 Tax=Prosthecobacter sp. TaxID=1965333 RepID=UPI00378373F2
MKVALFFALSWLPFALPIHAGPVKPVRLPEVILDAAGPEIFPPSWRSAPVSAEATVLDEALRARSQKLLAAALARYPYAVLQKHLHHVYVVGRLAYSGVPTGGTNSRTAVYLANSGKASDAVLEGIFHAEFSSILLRNLPQNLDTNRWLQINPPGFRYLGSGVQAIKQQRASRQLDAELHKAGFLHAYAQASQEEDFNSLASRLLMGDPGLWSAMAQFPKIQEKAALVMDFYGRLHPQFTPAWFKARRMLP